MPRLSLINQLGSSGLEVALLGKTRRSACSGLIAGQRRRPVADHLVQMCADGVQAVMLGDAVVVERLQQVEAGLRASHHGDRYGAVERDHWIRRDAFE